MKEMTLTEMGQTKGGEAITISAVLALMAIGLVAVVAYKMFFSSEGKTQLPGGFVFQWK